MNPKINKAQKEDTKKLAQLYLEQRIATFSWMPAETFKLEDFAADTDGERILVATEDKELLGFVSIWLEDRLIHHIYVSPKYQRAGVGKKLLEYALKAISRPARVKCVIQNENACRFFEKQGWKVESTGEAGPLGPQNCYVLF